MLIDCDGCRVRGAGCAGCLVTALLDTDSPAAGLGAAEHRAIEVLTRSGFEVEVLAHETRRARSTRRRVA